MKTLSKAILFAGTMAIGLTAQTTTTATPPAPPDPATIVQRRVDRLTKVLGLSTAQAAQATTIFLQAENTVQPLQTNLSQAHQSMPAAVKTNATATIDQLSTTIGTLTGQIIDTQSKANAAFYLLLTPDQQTKFSQVGMGRGGFGPMGMGMGMGGPGMRMGPRRTQ